MPIVKKNGNTKVFFGFGDIVIGSRVFDSVGEIQISSGKGPRKEIGAPLEVTAQGRSAVQLKFARKESIDQMINTLLLIRNRM